MSAFVKKLPSGDFPKRWSLYSEEMMREREYMRAPVCENDGRTIVWNAPDQAGSMSRLHYLIDSARLNGKLRIQEYYWLAILCGDAVVAERVRRQFRPGNHSGVRLPTSLYDMTFTLDLGIMFSFASKLFE